MKTYQLLENTDMAVNEDVVDIIEPVTEHTRELAIVIARLMVFLISGGTANSIGARTMVLAPICTPTLQASLMFCLAVLALCKASTSNAFILFSIVVSMLNPFMIVPFCNYLC